MASRFDKLNLITKLSTLNIDFRDFVDKDKKVKKILTKDEFKPILTAMIDSEDRENVVKSFISFFDTMKKLVLSPKLVDQQAGFELLGKWDTATQTQQKANYLSAVSRQNILSDSSDLDSVEQSTFNMICNNMLPVEYSWDYWVFINQWFDYWVNQFEITCDKKYLYDTKKILRILIASGTLAIWFENDTLNYGYPVVNKEKPDTFDIYIGSSLLGQDFYQGIYSIYSKEPKPINGNKINKKLDDIIIVNWRSSGIGDYVWCLKPILMDIHLQRVVQANTYRCDNKRDIKAPNIEQAKRISKINSIATRIYNYFISDPNDKNNEFPVRPMLDTVKSGVDNTIAASIEGVKFHQEQYYTLFGRKISSSKNQALSSDASLSVSSTEAIRNEHIWRIENAFEIFKEKFNIDIVVKGKEDEALISQNENADKNGDGISNTDGAIQKEKSEAMK